MHRRLDLRVVKRAVFFIASADNDGKSDAAMFSATCFGRADFTVLHGKNFICFDNLQQSS